VSGVRRFRRVFLLDTEVVSPLGRHPQISMLIISDTKQSDSSCRLATNGCALEVSDLETRLRALEARTECNDGQSETQN